MTNPTIVIAPDGPYLVSGPVPLAEQALPFCDGTHAHIGFRAHLDT